MTIIKGKYFSYILKTLSGAKRKSYVHLAKQKKIYEANSLGRGQLFVDKFIDNSIWYTLDGDSLQLITFKKNKLREVFLYSSETYKNWLQLAHSQ